MTDVIELNDSDDDIGIIEDESSKNAGASIDILNSVPLDLNALLGGGGVPAMRPRPNGHASARAAHGTVRATTQLVPRPTHSPYQRPLTATVRLAVNGSGGVPQRYASTAIRSSTAVTHMTSYQPLHRHSSAQQHYPQQQQQPLPRPLNGMQNGSMRAAGGGQGEVMKMRLQMAHNGSYQRLPPRDFTKPQQVMLGEEVSAERLKNYAFDTERGVIGTKGVADGVMNSQRFRCTYGTCSALIFGNVNFMNHVWSHVAVWKLTDEEVVEKGKTDVDALSTCPQCLARFEYPYQMQIHYTRAHSRLKQAVVGNTCAICEKEVTSLKHHLAMHHPRDAPYRCPACTYKCNIRMHLYDHFARRHSHHTTLMCPFCCYFKTVEVPQSKHKKRYHIIKCREFVNHMKKHESVTDKRDNGRDMSDGVVFNPVEAATNKRRIACDKCAQCFTKSEERIGHIKDMHTPLNDHYVCRPRAMETRNRRASELVFVAKGDHTICGDCKKKKPEERNKKCATCARLLFSVDTIAGKNIAYSDNVTRPSVRALATAPVARGKCSCKFASSSGVLLAAHFCACRRTIRVQLKTKKEEGEGGEKKKEKEEEEEKEKPTRADEKQEREEMALFAIEDEGEKVVDEERVRESLALLHAELEDAVVERIRGRDAPPTPVVSKKGQKAWIPIKDPDAMDQLEERLNSIRVEPEAMTFRTRISRNDMAESEKKFKEMMARREEE